MKKLTSILFSLLVLLIVFPAEAKGPNQKFLKKAAKKVWSLDLP